MSAMSSVLMYRFALNWKRGMPHYHPSRRLDQTWLAMLTTPAARLVAGTAPAQNPPPPPPASMENYHERPTVARISVPFFGAIL